MFLGDTLIFNILKDTKLLRPHPENKSIYGEESIDRDLLQSIHDRGMLEPIVINDHNVILSGHRRWIAAKELKIDRVPCRIVSFENELDELEALIEFNRQRIKTFVQSMNEGDKLSIIASKRAKQRIIAAQNNNAAIAASATLRQQVAENTGKTSEAVAEKIGMKPRTYEKAAAVWKRAKEGDEKALEFIEKVDKGEVTINKAYNEVIKKPAFEEHIQKQREEIENGAARLPEGTFEVLVVDPPWNYGTEYNADGRRVANPYPEMTREELIGLDMPSSENAVMFLWTTHRFIWDAKELLEEWGFNYRNIIVWNKEKIGMGDLFRMQCEFCLVGIRGKPIIDNDHTWRDIITEARREHSRKPDGFYDMVDRLCVGRKVDYFSRIERAGWATFGNDTGRFS